MELKKVAQDLGEDLTDEEIEKMFVKGDLDDDGFITSDDFYNIMTHRVYWDQWSIEIWFISLLWTEFLFLNESRFQYFSNVSIVN